eukprot:736485-Prorocentrum_minimum.AAC.2
MSTSAPYWVVPRRSSGERYHRLTTPGVYVLCSLSPCSRASPKSHTLRVPALSISRLGILRSRCTTHISWSAARARRSCCIRPFT